MIDYIDSVDQHCWRQERQKIHGVLQSLALSTAAALAHNLDDIDSIPQDRILFCRLFDLMPSIDEWQQIDRHCQILGKKIWFVTDNIIDQEKHAHFKNVSIWSYPTLLGMTASYQQDSILAIHPQKLYNCFIQRCESVRQSWLYFLWSENLLDQGYVSYLLWQLKDYSELTGRDLFDFIHQNKGLDSSADFNKAYHALRPLVPYRNFPENFNLIEYILDSKYSLILETYAVQDDRYQWCVTEKTLRALQFGTINLIFAQKHTSRVLTELNIEVDPINQEFDDLDWIARQRKILEILKSDRVKLDRSYKHHQCSHNRSLLAEWQQMYNRPDFFDDLKEDIQKS